MAINKKLIHFKKREYFDREVANGNVPEHSICFIKDTKQIWTHGQLYNCSVDLTLDKNSNNPIANSAVANAISGGIHFAGVINSNSVPNLTDSDKPKTVIGTWYDFNYEENSQEFNIGDIIILVYNPDGYPEEPTKEYILAEGFDSELGYGWVELGDVSPAQGMINESLNNYYKKSETYNKSEVDSIVAASSTPDNVLTVDSNNVLNKSNLIIGGVEIKNGLTQYILTAENLYNDDGEIDSFNVEAQFTGNYVNETDGEGNETGTQFMEFEVTYADNNMSELTTLYVRILNSNWDENNQISGDYLDIKTTPNTDYLSCGGSNIVLTKMIVETLNTDSVCEILINGEKVATKSEIPSMTNVLKVENDGLLNRDNLKIQTRKASDPENSEEYIDGDSDTFFNVEDGLFNVEVQNSDDAYLDTEIYSDGTSIQLKSNGEHQYSSIEIASTGITMYQNDEGDEVSFSINSDGVTINGVEVVTGNTSNFATKTELAAKQDKLVSGTNVKTINGTTILGNGDIVINGSSAYSEVNHGTSDTTFTLTPNTFHVWDEVTELTLTLGSETSGVANEYLFQFTSGSEPTTLSLPVDIKWTGGETPTIETNKIYQLSILKGLGNVLAWDNAPTLIDNKVTMSISGTKYLVSLQYAATSDIVVNVRTQDGLIPVNVLSGEVSKTASPLGPIVDSEAYIESITPTVDNNYNYTW